MSHLFHGNRRGVDQNARMKHSKLIRREEIWYVFIFSQTYRKPWLGSYLQRTLKLLRSLGRCRFSHLPPWLGRWWWTCRRSWLNELSLLCLHQHHYLVETWKQFAFLPLQPPKEGWWEHTYINVAQHFTWRNAKKIYIYFLIKSIVCLQSATGPQWQRLGQMWCSCKTV